MGVPQGVERDGQVDACCHVRPFLGEGAGRLWRAVKLGEQQVVVRQLAEPKLEPQFKLLLAVIAKCLNNDVGQADDPNASISADFNFWSGFCPMCGII